MLGAVTAAAAADTGLPEGLPVVCGTGDFPATLLGSGVCRPGMGSDVTGTSTILTVIADQPVRSPDISNLRTVDDRWGACIFLDSGGDAMRWARKAFHEGKVDFDRIVQLAEQTAPGAKGLLFLPYLAGERLGTATNARAQFFGLDRGHETGHLHRAVLEGVGLAVLRHLRIIEAAGHKPERIVASGGGAKGELWMKIKASVFDVPYKVPGQRGMRRARQCDPDRCRPGPVRRHRVGGGQAGALREGHLCPIRAGPRSTVACSRCSRSSTPKAVRSTPCSTT